MSLRSILLVLGGAVSFGILSTIVKLAYGQGFVIGEVLGSQVFTGWCILLVLFLMAVRRTTGWKQTLRLSIVGTFSCLTGWLYYSSLQTIPASLAIILLFQFAWIGVVLEAVAKRRLPDRSKVIAVIILFGGTLLAGGIGVQSLEWNTGIIYGLLSAVSFSLFIFFSGNVETQLHPIHRAFLMTSGAMVLAFLMFPPHFLMDGVLWSSDLWKYGVPLGFFGMVLPNLLFAAGMPKVGPGLGTILGSAELPTAVLLSRFILDESVSLLQWGGVVLILVGIALPQWKHFRTAKKLRMGTPPSSSVPHKA